MRIDKSEKYFERAKKVSPGGVHSPVRAFRGVGGTPRFIESAKGAYLRDVDGNSYLDFCMSWGPLIFGHQDEDVAEAVRGALTRGWSFGAAEPYSLELAEFITTNIPFVEKVRFVNSGTEAVMSALRVARAATGRNKIIKFEGCYHGHVDSMLVKAGSGLAEMTSPDSAGVSKSTAADTLVAPLNDLETVEAFFKNHPGEIAGIIIEPLPANNGLLIQTRDFLLSLQNLCRKNGALFILDEVISGFRIGFGGMAELWDMKPDLVTYGKIIGGGFPVGAYGGRKDLMDLVAPAGPVYQAGTLSANPVAMSAGIACLKKLKAHSPYESMNSKVEHLSVEIESMLKEFSIKGKVQRFGSVFWSVMGDSDKMIRSVSEIPSTQKEQFAKLFHLLLDDGIYLAPSGFEVSFLSTVHGDKELGIFLEKFRKGLKSL